MKVSKTKYRQEKRASPWTRTPQKHGIGILRGRSFVLSPRRSTGYAMASSEMPKEEELQGWIKSMAGIDEEWLKQSNNQSRWDKLASVLSDQLPPGSETRIHEYYLPVYFWIRKKLEEHSNSSQAQGIAKTPIFIGLSAPQGCGKTTLVTCLEELFKYDDEDLASCIAMSLDDFYLTHAELRELASKHEGNPLVQVRGNAGTHDVQFAQDVLSQLKNGNPEVSIPLYDKSAHQGAGDRHSPDKWRKVDGSKVDVVIFEGWMQGFTETEDTSKLGDIHEGLEFINEKLSIYTELWESLDVWIIIKVPELDWIFQWRLEAEHAMLRGGQDGMTDEQIKDFVSRYIPAYKAYLPKLYDNLPPGCESIDKRLIFAVDMKRNPSSFDTSDGSASSVEDLGDRLKSM